MFRTIYVTPPTRHPLSSEGVIFFSIYYKLIKFKLVYSYNVKHLTCTIFCSSGLQNIYKLHIYRSVQHLQYLHCLQKKQKYIYIIPNGVPVGS